MGELLEEARSKKHEARSSLLIQNRIHFFLCASRCTQLCVKRHVDFAGAKKKSPGDPFGASGAFLVTRFLKVLPRNLHTRRANIRMHRRDASLRLGRHGANDEAAALRLLAKFFELPCHRILQSICEAQRAPRGNFDTRI